MYVIFSNLYIFQNEFWSPKIYEWKSNLKNNSANHQKDNKFQNNDFFFSYQKYTNIVFSHTEKINTACHNAIDCETYWNVFWCCSRL